MKADLLSGRLLPNERVLWSGRPGQGLLLSRRDVFLIPFSLLWCGFAVFWETGVVSGKDAPAFFIFWGAMFVCIGLYFVFGRFLVDAWVRRGMFYAITNQRVLISRSPPFGKFTTLALAQIADVDLHERSDGRGDISFGKAASMWGRQNMGLWSPALDSVPQFLMIDGARGVFDLIQKEAVRQ